VFSTHIIPTINLNSQFVKAAHKLESHFLRIALKSINQPIAISISSSPPSSSSASKMYSFQQLNKATRKNNHGAYLLENNQIDEGVAVICDALQDFQELQQSCPHDNSESSSHSWIIRLSEEERIKNTSKTNDDEQDQEGLFIYKRPLQIPEQQLQHIAMMDQQLPLWTDHVTELSFIIIFNLALGYQLQANSIRRCSNDDEEEQEQRHRWSLLHKSKSLYEIAYELMMSKPEAFSVNLSLVVSNNLGQILQATHDHERAHSCFSHLLSIVMYLKDCGGMDDWSSSSSSTSSGKLSLLDGFLKSTTYLVLQPATAAAA
jgi:hypothetical protein